MIWWKDSPLDFERFKRELEEFESLQLSIVNDKVIVSGRWAVFGETQLITRYDISIEMPDDYSHSVPKVFETGGVVKKIPDNHFNQDGSACLFVEPERFEKWPPGSSFRDFLNGPVKEFFFSQAFHQMTGKWPFGERRHFEVGIAEYYFERLETKTLELTIDLLKIDTTDRIYRQTRCPCYRKNRFVKCHAPKLRALKEVVPSYQIEKDIAALQKVLEVIKNRRSSTQS